MRVWGSLEKLMGVWWSCCWGCLIDFWEDTRTSIASCCSLFVGELQFVTTAFATEFGAAITSGFDLVTFDPTCSGINSQRCVMEKFVGLK